MSGMTEEVKSAIDDVFELCFRLEDRVKALEQDIASKQVPAPVFTVFEGGRTDPPRPAEPQAAAPRSNQALGRWKEFSTKVTPELSDFITRIAQTRLEGALVSDVLHDAMIALCEKEGIEIDWLTARDEGPLVMDQDEPCPDTPAS